jgi:hypothetical protein
MLRKQRAVRFQNGAVMSESTHVAQNGFERGLATLAQLGLVRPANVLLAEYLAALTAEEILNATTAERLSAVYNRVRYSAVSADDPELQEAVATLESVAARLTAWSADERRQVLRRVRARLPLPPTDDGLERETACLSDARTPIPPTRHANADRHSSPQSRAAHPSPRPHIEPASTNTAFGDVSNPLDEFDALPVAPAAAATTRRVGLPRLSLELAAVVGLATFFSGYLVRDAFRKTVEVADEVGGGSGEHLTLNDAWKDQGAWVHGVRARGDQDAEARHFQKARLELELVHAYVPRDAAVLNDLAALYLTRDESGRTDPTRALELIERALTITRQPTILDTAAEAHFQCGHIDEAIRLERESLSKELAWSNASAGQFRQYRQQQLERFREAEPVRTAQLPAGPTEPSVPAAEAAKGKMNAPLAAQPGNPAGS